MASFTGAVSDASSTRLPPQRVRVSSQDSSPGPTSVTFVASGKSSRAATCAITSLPRSVPDAETRRMATRLRSAGPETWAIASGA